MRSPDQFKCDSEDLEIYIHGMYMNGCMIYSCMMACRYNLSWMVFKQLFIWYFACCVVYRAVSIARESGLISTKHISG